MKTYMLLLKREFNMTHKSYAANNPKEAVQKALEDSFGFQGWSVVAVFTIDEWARAIRRKIIG